MKICPICQTKFQEDILFCPQDGERLDDYIDLKDPTDPLIGYVLDNKYRIDRKIAVGGMSNIYLANHMQLDIQVAVKVMHDRLVSDEKAIRRFRREAQSAMRIRHTNAITVLDFGVTDRKLVYLIMEYLQGCTLKDKLKRQTLLPLKEINNIFQQVCAAVKIAHRRGIIHRDLKPENIFLQQDGDLEIVKVLDFGIAKLQFSEENLTQMGTSLGSPHYMAPEQLGDNEQIDLRADVYSLGVILFELLTGETLFTGSSSTAIAFKHISEKPREICSIRPDLSLELESVVQKALEKNPSSRYEDIASFLEDLTEAFLNLDSVDESISDSANRRLKSNYQQTEDDSATLLRLYTKPEWPAINIPIFLHELPVYYNLEALFLPEFFGALAADKVSGITWFSSSTNIKGVVWQNGEIVFAVSNDQTERLGERLVRQGRISRQQYIKALREQKDQENESILQTLTNIHFLPEETTSSLLNAHIYSICYSLIDWEEGGYAFDASPFSQDFAVSISVGELILESIRSLIDIGRIRAFLGNEELWLCATNWPDRDKIMLRADESTILNHLSSPNTITKLLELVDFPEEQVLRTLAALLSLRALARVEKPQIEETIPPKQEPVAQQAVVNLENISFFFYELENISSQLSRAGNDYFARLGASSQTSFEEITKNYQQLKEKFDPSKHQAIIEQMPSLKSQIENIYQSISEAYEKLSSTIQNKPKTPTKNLPPIASVMATPQKPIIEKPIAQAQQPTIPATPVKTQQPTIISPKELIAPTVSKNTGASISNPLIPNNSASIPNTSSLNASRPSSPFPSSHNLIPSSSKKMESINDNSDIPQNLPPSLQNFNNPAKLRNPDDWYLYGLDLMDKSDMERAARAFRQAIALRPKDAEFHAALGRCYAEVRGYNEQTITELEEAINLTPKSPDYRAELGTFYLKHNRIELARKYIDAALEIKADHKAALKAKKKLDDIKE
ncbi:MAG: protein kinase [Acidobacteria bacterium]|nr:protein kinase [Acidobacteriota bacterium]